MPFKPIRALLCLLFLLAVSAPVAFASQPSGEVRLKRVVIDPGHGGTDPGSLSPDKKLREKDVNLYVAKKLGEYINEAYPEVEVFYTRTKDVQVALDKRSSFANNKKADLFISIHCNSVKNATPCGSETFVMGMHKNDANFEVCLKENSVITLEEDYKTTYQGFEPNNPESYIIFNLMQSASLEQSVEFANLIQKQLVKGPIRTNRGIKQGGLLVLWKTTMPAVLVEIGFISNKSDRAVLATSTGKDQIAKQLFNAFAAYKKQYDGGVSINTGAADTKQAAASDGSKNAQAAKSDEARDTAAKADDAKDEYRIQIFALSQVAKTTDSRFKGEKTVKYVKDGNLYKYSVGAYKTRAAAEADLARVRKNFNGAFIVHVVDGKIVK